VDEIIQIAHSHWGVGSTSAILIVIPPPTENAMDPLEIEDVIRRAVDLAESKKIDGKDVTPFLLRTVNELTEGKSLSANLSLLHNNARIASEIAICYSQSME
jgi:pseudouridine-5'-phosphate glycosidase